MKCPHCQAENSDNAKFCVDCGRTLQTDVTCPKCRHTNKATAKFCEECGHALIEKAPEPTKPTSPQPTSFASGRYQVKKFLGEGGKKKVYLAHDTTLDRDVAFALIKTEKLDEVAKTRIKREARAMGKLGDHPHIVTIHDMGEHEGQPYIVIPYLPGGDVEGLIKKAPDHKLPLDKAIDITKAVCKGLEFAHAKGIIHRDLKPGNVWLSADGTAKIGDFGLAVAVELTRLTKSGMMVGTVSYMPPEQAMGSKVTAKADLYSLGAMLYEMVTGRPPFVGDDSVSIIGQHINTPPISPTWHRADLPPALETLIIQLLEKDPDKRPSSAVDVLQALESIDAVKVSKEQTKETTIKENPIYRRVFVGREPELKQLQNAFDGAMSGQGALMMVVGEPGIGKTALCEQLSTYVKLRGGKTLVGHCYEEGSLSLPYLAFVEAMRSYVLSRDIKDLREELGTAAIDVARIVSEVRERLKVKLRPQKDPEEDRYRLMQAVTSFINNAACVQPLFILLEDLHDADKGTLDMLAHISRHLSGARLLILGTYRDVEVDRSHPLSAALAELRRVATYDRVILRGLNADEVRRMLESITHEEIPWSLAEAVHRQTEGNPLFVQEVVRFLVEEGLLTQKDGRWRPTKDTPLETSIPEGLRDVIGKRLSMLSKECNQLLSAGAVIGREFDLEILKAVTDIDEEVFINALNEAVQLSVLEEKPQVGLIKYRFTHAFFRQTLYEELIAPRRLRLHQQVARALEKQYEKRLGEHAAELAEHFSQSTDPADLEKAVKYGEMSAKRASDVYAYGEAARLLDQAVSVQRVLNPDDKEKICDLLIDLCDALMYAGEPRRVVDIECPAALSLAESMGDKAKISLICQKAMIALSLHGMLDAIASQEAAWWADMANLHSEPDTIERARADMYLGVIRVITGHPAEGVPRLKRSLEIARRKGDYLTQAWTIMYYIAFAVAPQHNSERLVLAEELNEMIHNWQGKNLPASMRGAFVLTEAFIVNGQRHRAEQIITEHQEMAERTRQVHDQIISIGFDIGLAVLDGHLEETLEIAERMLERGEQLGVKEYSQFIKGQLLIRPLIHLGKYSDALELAREPCTKALCLAHLMRNGEVSEILEKDVVMRPDIGTLKDEMDTWRDILHLEAGILINHYQVAELLLNRFKDAGLCTSDFLHCTCVPRHLGGASVVLGRYDEARKYYQEAIKVCTEIRFRPELALSRLQLAELLLEHFPDEKKEALEHLDFAIKEFREMKMQPSLERALSHKDILKA